MRKRLLLIIAAVIVGLASIFLATRSDPKLSGIPIAGPEEDETQQVETSPSEATTVGDIDALMADFHKRHTELVAAKQTSLPTAAEKALRVETWFRLKHIQMFSSDSSTEATLMKAIDDTGVTLSPLIGKTPILDLEEEAVQNAFNWMMEEYNDPYFGARHTADPALHAICLEVVQEALKRRLQVLKYPYDELPPDRRRSAQLAYWQRRKESCLYRLKLQRRMVERYVARLDEIANEQGGGREREALEVTLQNTRGSIKQLEQGAKEAAEKIAEIGVGE